MGLGNSLHAWGGINLPRRIKSVLLDKPQPTDEQLAAEAAREGSDGPAFVALVERFQERVWRVCYRLLGNSDDALDAAQDVLVKMFMQRTQFEARSRYSTWVHGIAIKTCLTIRRGRGRRQRREDRAGTDEAEAATRKQSGVGGLDTKADLQQMLETLDEEDRALLIMKYAEDYSYDELAAIFELSVSACKMRVSRARAKLQERFPEHALGDEIA